MTTEATISGNHDAINRTFHVMSQPLALLPNYYAWTYGRFRPWLIGTVIELGCGAGLGLPHYVDGVDRVVAVDHDDQLLARIRASAPPNVETRNVDLLADRWSDFDDCPADAVLMMDVAEHFADDRKFLGSAMEVLKPGGHLLIKVPAQSRLYGEMDRSTGHYRRYDPADLKRLASAIGADLLRLDVLNRLGGIAYGLRRQRSTNFSRSFAPWQLRLINHALPLIRAADALPLSDGLSLAAVLRKPA